ncbi:hypothetical protein GPJ56_007310 [Histomonas meleagridis]|uniref:uncharacterized protein n=1 Tax=Histomonas meleagridis TaxID=135588 RepID=UPI003559FBBA|nr:hypothetical protein GPJ56_007310 [Histomonas meleagridis]KAH0804156.1 hypothetical protein GO595_002986 [Histomonas meleagridis]
MSESRQQNEPTAIALTDEIIDHCEKGYKNLAPGVIHRINHIISILRQKKIRTNSSLEIGDLIASLTELVPINCRTFLDLCDSIASVCIDREYAQFADEAIETVSNIILNHLELKSMDPTYGLRALSTILYNNTLRLKKYHKRIMRIAVTLSTVSDESKRRSCVLVGNLSAFSQRSNDTQIYKESITFISNSLKGGSSDLLSSALRALQLLILDCPKNLLEPQTLTHIISTIIFQRSSTSNKFEAIMALKALVQVTESSFYSQWPILLTKSPSLFNMLKLNQKVAKSTADLLTDIFRDTWKYIYIADNISKKTSFTTLAQQIGDVVDICFNRFLQVLDISSKDKLDEIVFNKTSKAFATFIRNCSFDSGRLKNGYVENIINWCKTVLTAKPEESLIVMKSLLWLNVNFRPFSDSFDYLFQTFLKYINNPNEDYAKPARFALCRIAYGYPTELIQRYQQVKPILREIGPIHSLPILLRLVEKEVNFDELWNDLFEFHIPTAIILNHIKSIQRSLQIIGISGQIFDKLPDNIQRFCMSTVLNYNYPQAYQAIGLLSRSSAADLSSVFLNDAFEKLTKAEPPQLQALSNVLEAYALRHQSLFKEEWINVLFDIFKKDNSNAKPRCIGFLFAFVKDKKDKINYMMNMLMSYMDLDEPKMRWNSAAAISTAFSFGCFDMNAIIKLINALENDEIAKVKIKATEALINVDNREQFADEYYKLFVVSLKLLLMPIHFTNLSLALQRKYDAKFKENLTKLFFKLLTWSKPRDFSQLENILIANVDEIYALMEKEDNPPWQQITKLYEAKFNSIPYKILEKFQEKAFPI